MREYIIPRLVKFATSLSMTLQLKSCRHILRITWTSNWKTILLLLYLPYNLKRLLIMLKYWKRYVSWTVNLILCSLILWWQGRWVRSYLVGIKLGAPMLGQYSRRRCFEIFRRRFNIKTVNIMYCLFLKRSAAKQIPITSRIVTDSVGRVIIL